MPKQISPAKNWVFTLHNPRPVFLHKQLSEHCSKFLFQEETCPTTGELHLQGACVFKKKLRPLSLQLDPRIHWEKMKGTWQESVDYCSKEESRAVDSFRFHHGFLLPEPLRIISTLRPWQQALVSTLTDASGNLKDASDRSIHWYWEPTGNVGKTALAKYLVHHFGALVVGGKGADCKYGVVSYKEQHGAFPKLIIYNVPRSFNTEFICWEALESIKDGLFYSTKYESAMACFNSPHVVVFANEYPDVSKLSQDRWIIKQITNYAGRLPFNTTLNNFHDHSPTKSCPSAPS